MKVTRKEAVEFYSKLQNLKIGEYNKFLLYAIMKNKIELKKIFDEVADKERLLSSSTELLNFEKERIQIVKEFAKKDESGLPIIIDNRFDVPEESAAEIQSKLMELREKYKDTFEKNRNDIEEYEKYTAEEIEFQETKTAFKNLPEQMTSDVFDVLIKLSDDPE